MPANPILSAEHLTRRFGKGAAAVVAVDDVSLSLCPGELALIMGPSGSGKTTLLSMLGALLRPSAGTVTIDGVEATALSESGLSDLRARKLGFVFQAFNLVDALTVEENILFPALLARGGVRGARARADALMERLALAPRRSARPATLSGGEKQRVAIARALINNPPILLADEPTGNLDSQTGQEVMMILYDVARDDGAAVLIVTHDPRVEDIADRMLWLEDGALRDRRAESHEWVRDPVCGMRVDAWTAARETHYEGARYVFCSQRCLERFAASPTAYAAEAEPIGKAPL